MTTRGRTLSDDPVEHLRRGTLEQFESEWVWLEPDSGAAGGEAITAARRHGLNEIPALVSVERDDWGDGRNARDATADVTVTKDRDEVVITNAHATEGFYVRIRAR